MALKPQVRGAYGGPIDTSARVAYSTTMTAYRDWSKRSACGGMMEDADNLTQPQFIKVYCNNCPVRRDCLEEGLWNNYSGVWGGKSDGQRKAIMHQYKELAHTTQDSEDFKFLSVLLHRSLDL